MTEIAFGAYEPDVASIGTPKTSYVNNVVPTVNGYGPIAAINPFSGAMAGTCRGVIGAVQLDSSTAIFGGSDTNLYKLDSTTRAWADVTRAAGGNYSVTAKELWDFTQFGNYVIATTNNNDVQAYQLGSSSKFAALGGSPPQARRCTVVGQFLVLSGLTANPNRINWSAINNITGWTSGTSQSDFQDFPDGGYVQGVAGGEVGLVFQDRAIRRMIYVGPPLVFEFQRISQDRGVLMRYSIGNMAGNTYFLSNDGFYAIDNSGGLRPIGANRVNNTVLAELDSTDQRNMVCVPDPASKRIFWFYKTTTKAIANTLDSVLVYDVALDRFTHCSDASLYAINATSVIPLSTTLEGLDSVGTLDALLYSLDTYTSTFSSAIAVMTPGGRLGFLNGANVEATIHTPEGAIGNGVRTLVRNIAPVGDASGAMVSVRHRDRLIDSVTTSTEYAIDTRGYAAARVNARFNTARIRVPAGASWSYLRGVDVDARKSGAR